MIRLCAPFACCLVLATGHAATIPDHELPTRAEVHALMDMGKTWLLEQQQEDGSFYGGEMFRLGITELATLALLDAGVAPDDPAIAKAVDWILTHRQEDGAIFDPNEGLRSYSTALGLQVLARVGADEEVIEGAQKALFDSQNLEEGSWAYGGIGYGSRGEGHEDLSNTTTAIEALRESGVPADHPAMQRALKFVERCQNHSSTNDMEWAGNDGGGVYSPDSSQAGGSYHDGTALRSKPKEGAEGKATELQSYGSMTYALIKTYIYLDVDKDDPRLRAALEWANKNYQFEVNPGMLPRQRKEGLFYFYQAMAKTYDLLDVTTLDLGKKSGGETDWRADLFHAIRERAQVSDQYKNVPAKAFWINEAPRWAEGIPHLTTSYMLTTLKRIHDSLPEGG